MLRLFPFFPRSIACIACRLAFGLARGFPGYGFFLFAGELGRGGGSRLFLAALLLGLGGLAGQFGLGALGSRCLALGLPLLDRGIVGTRLAAKLVQDAFPGFLRRLLPVREARFLESTH